MTNEEKATEIANEVAQETDYKNTAAYEAAMQMAQRKDEYYKLLLIHIEMGKKEEIQNLKDEILSKLVDLSRWKNNRPISKLGGWHKEIPTEDCTVLLYTETQFHKNAPYVIAEWDNHAQCFYDEADDEPISEWIKWKKL